MHSGANSETYISSYVEGYVCNSELNRNVTLKSKVKLNPGFEES